MIFLDRLLHSLAGNPDTSATSSHNSTKPVSTTTPPPAAPSTRTQSFTPHPNRQNHEAATPAMPVHAPDGSPQYLAASVGRGSEGEVFRISGIDTAVVKLYHPEILTRREHICQLSAKVRALATFDEFKACKDFAWPLFGVFDAQRQWVGFAMNRVEGISLNVLMAPAAMRKDLPHWNRRHLVSVAGRIALHLNNLAKAGVIVGDISPNNFLTDPETCKVSLIDCDSYQVRRGEAFFPCPVATPSHAAPELLAAKHSDVVRTEEMLRFSAAILFFQILTGGVHPYQHNNSINPVEDILAGKCPLYRGSGVCLRPSVWERYGCLPYPIKDLFVRTFHHGHKTPSVRPSLDEWSYAFRSYYAELKNY